MEHRKTAIAALHGTNEGWLGVGETAFEPGGRKEAAHAALRLRILTLALAPGHALDEAALAREYGLSRPPLREVLRQMAGEGYVELRRNRGAVVAPMGYDTLRAFFLAAPMIYAAVSRLAAQNATPAGIAALRAIQARFRAAILGGSTEERVHWNDRFHARIGEMSANRYLLPSLRCLLIDHARIGMTFYRAGSRPADAGNADRLETAAAQHDAMIEAYEAGDEEEADRLARAHWALSRDLIASFAMPDGLDAPLGIAGMTPERGGEP